MPDQKLITRFMSKVNFDGPTADHMDSACWLWTAGTRKNKKGGGEYGKFRVGASIVSSHRFAYEIIVGPIPAGLVLDHVCGKETRCVNPSHLEPVTPKINQERRVVGANGNSKSGVRGVSWHSPGSKWRVEVRHNGTKHRGGYFTDLAEAEQAAIALREKLFGTDENRREFTVAGPETQLAASA